jgi:hypothetical protein
LIRSENPARTRTRMTSVISFSRLPVHRGPGDAEVEAAPWARKGRNGPPRHPAGPGRQVPHPQRNRSRTAPARNPVPPDGAGFLAVCIAPGWPVSWGDAELPARPARPLAWLPVLRTRPPRRDLRIAPAQGPSWALLGPLCPRSYRRHRRRHPTEPGYWEDQAGGPRGSREIHLGPRAQEAISCRASGDGHVT